MSWHSAILLGIGDDDTVDTISEAGHTNEQAARAWVEQHLPTVEFPEWVKRRRHGTAGAFLLGQIQRGRYTGPGDDDWEPGHNDPRWDAVLENDIVRWRVRD